MRASDTAVTAYEQISCAVADGIATLTLDRPEARNGYTPQMADELAHALRAADADHAVRVVVLTGAGRDFCVGADLSAGRDKGEGFSQDVGKETLRQLEEGSYQEPAGLVTRELYALNKPVIAAVRGAAVGVGSTMLLPADYRLAAHGTKFGFPFTRRGIVPEGASAWFLPRLVGLGRAMDWLVSGRIVPADEALAAGLVHSLHAPDEVLDAAYALARELVAHTAPVSVAITRQLVYRMAWAESPEDVHRLDSRLVFDTVRGADAREGVRSFFERRPPRFPGRVPEDLPPYLPWSQARPGDTEV
ncbi:enoyl-CoA hydratase-related protein [Streptomyces xanthii]|uniref:Enoyl-CoA hydratase/isomerase family protein n=1 Tax=Streptomyces xanthii TaxID=2768069 RepID=A0A7H1B2L0_9ACTN|nr:enoyl-CoA hydratase-related protein [Streptomyces xanthii]QNS02965.1 enoyl-CoA hydratase/isomerase family protein [Streptomyces xanthii]